MNIVHQTFRNDSHSAANANLPAPWPQSGERPHVLRSARGHAEADTTARKPPRPVSERDWGSYPFEFLIRRVLQKQHDKIKQHLLRLQRETAGNDHAAEDRRTGKIAAKLTTLIQELMDDMAEEELIFPDLLRLEQAYVGEGTGYTRHLRQILSRLSHGNDRHLQEVDSIRREAGAACPDISGELGILQSALLDHLHVEHDIVFPRAASMEAELYRYSH